MARRSGFLHSLVRAQQEAERHRIAVLRQQARLQTEAAKAAEKARKNYERAIVADQKEHTRLYNESRITQVNLQNEQLQQTIFRLSNILTEALSVDSFINLRSLKQAYKPVFFNAGQMGIPEPPPILETYLPADLTGFQKIRPGAKEKHEQEKVKAHERYKADVANHRIREETRLRRLTEAQSLFERQVAEAKQQLAAQHAEIETFQQELSAGTPSAVMNYFTMALSASDYPEGFPQHAKIAYVPESKQLVVEYDLPPFEIVPEVGLYKYVKTKDEITETQRPLAQRKSLYSSIVAQVALRTLHELFEADRLKHLDVIVFNGYVDSIDRGTGRPVRACLITVRTSRDIFMQLDLSKVDPLACLITLNASVSKSPTELAPVRPVLEFNMVDPRFIEETDVISTLDQRPNLMDLTPSEFESLITNLFQKMGLETRLTQASRDGGVDCVAYDPRPIFGGKVVIQAKRYKNTVGVSSVRDLFGTMQNEGASKGILVTTSGYGQASYEFAEGKPIELLSGSNLLYLLAEHAGIEAKIETPDNWKDPQPDNA